MAQIATRVSEEEKRRIEAFAQANDLTISQVLRKAIKEFLDKEE